MLLLDIGNTAVKIAYTSADTILKETRCATETISTIDDLCSLLAEFCHTPPTGLLQPPVCVASSVVPKFFSLVTEAVRRECACPLYFVPRDLPVPLKNTYKKPETLGSDRLLAAYAARTLFPQNDAVIIVDMGTAITIDGVQGDRFLGGLILPGPDAALDGLRLHAANLKKTLPDYTGKPLCFGRTTEECLGQGIFFGYSSLLRGLLTELKAKLPGDTAVVATGGSIQKIGNAAELFDRIDPALVFEGLRAVALQQCPPLR